MGLGVYDEHSAVNPMTSLTIADTTVPKYVTQGGQRGTRIDALMLTSNAAAPVVVQLVLDSGTAYVLGTVAVPAGAGLDPAVPAVDAFAVFPVAPGALILAGGTTLKVGVTVTLGAADVVGALAFGGDF
ncbi:MAG: hypothetical protein NTU93_18700 [Arthrobacter sp.]|nr:hypothetical protein [Arthrobacter sp.]